MRNLVLAFTALVAVSVLYTQEPAKDKPQYSVSGSSSLFWEADFASWKHGFRNESSFLLKFPVLPKKTEGAVVPGSNKPAGEITVRDFELGISVSGSKGSIEVSTLNLDARIVAGAWYARIFSKPVFSMENAPFIRPYSILNYTDKSHVAPTQDIAGGVSLGRHFGDAGNAELRVGSIGTAAFPGTGNPPRETYIATGDEDTGKDALDGITYWEVDGTTPAPLILVSGKLYIRQDTGTFGGAGDRYVFGTAFRFKPFSWLGCTAGAQTDGNLKQIGLTGSFSINPADWLSFYAGIDAEYRPDRSKAAWVSDMAGSLAANPWDPQDTILLEAYFAGPESAGAETGELDLALKFMRENEMEPGPGFDAGIFFDNVFVVAEKPPLSFIERLSWRFDLADDFHIEPTETFGYNFRDPSGDPDLFYLMLGVECRIIPNTTFAVSYEVGEILEDERGSGFISGGKIDEGRLSLCVTVDF